MTPRIFELIYEDYEDSGGGGDYGPMSINGFVQEVCFYVDGALKKTIYTVQNSAADDYDWESPIWTPSFLTDTHGSFLINTTSALRGAYAPVLELGLAAQWGFANVAGVAPTWSAADKTALGLPDIYTGYYPQVHERNYHPFVGELDEVVMWRKWLSQTEVAARHSGSFGEAISLNNGAVVHHKFQEALEVWADISGSGLEDDYGSTLLAAPHNSIDLHSPTDVQPKHNGLWVSKYRGHTASQFEGIGGYINRKDPGLQGTSGGLEFVPGLGDYLGIKPAQFPPPQDYVPVEPGSYSVFTPRDDLWRGSGLRTAGATTLPQRLVRDHGSFVPWWSIPSEEYLPDSRPYSQPVSIELSIKSDTKDFNIQYPKAYWSAFDHSYWEGLAWYINSDDPGSYPDAINYNEWVATSDLVPKASRMIICGFGGADGRDEEASSTLANFDLSDPKAPSTYLGYTSLYSAPNVAALTVDSAGRLYFHEHQVEGSGSNEVLISNDDILDGNAHRISITTREWALGGYIGVGSGRTII